MLVLTRKPREEIRIGNGITITILRVKGQSVRVGIDAPNDVRIVRGELKPEEVDTETPVADDKQPVESATTSDSKTASLRSRCEKSPGVHAADSTAAMPCSSRLSSPRRNSTLQTIVARNRAAHAAVASSPSPGSGPPR